MEVRLKDFPREVFQIYTESLANCGDGRQSQNPAASLLFRIFSSINTDAMDEIHRIYRLIKSNKRDWK